MKKILTNPIMVNLEVNLIKEVIQIIGEAVHKSFVHNDVETIRQHLISKVQAATQESPSIPQPSQEKN